MSDPRDPVLRPDRPNQEQELEDSGYAQIDSHVPGGPEPVYGEPRGPRPPHFERKPYSRSVKDEERVDRLRYENRPDPERGGFFGGTSDPPAAPERGDPAITKSQ